MVAVPLREVPTVFVATLSTTIPLPVPVPPELTVIHPALLDAVREQPVIPATLTETGPPEAPTLALDGAIVKAVHAAAAWVTV